VALLIKKLHIAQIIGGRDMKKILPWLLLLLLLIIFCVWTKKDSIQLSSPAPTNSVTAPVVVANAHPIDYSITQTDNTYVLNGNFTNAQQQKSLSDTFAASAQSLLKKGTTINAALVGDDVIELTSKILPHFIKNYENGKIIYVNSTLKVYGDVSSYDIQNEMRRLLNTSKLASQENANVVIKKPIHYFIKKELDNVTFSGTFNDKAQIDVLRAKLPATTSIHLTEVSNHIDKGSIDTTANILPSFIEKYNHGSIQYKNEVLTVSGTVTTQADLDYMHKLLSTTKMPVTNLTTIDQAALEKTKAQAKAEADRLARIAAEEKAQKAKLVAEAQAKAEADRLARIAAEEKAQKAKLVAEAQAKLETERRAEEARKAEALKLLQKKEKIRKFLNNEKIEFVVSKGSLTAKGKSTVDKLVNILKQYSNIKIEIAGHTDSDGSAEFNQRLSQQRVNTVKSRLIAKGISATRLTAKGYGEAKPIVPNTSKANKQRNRRVEINIQGE